MIRSFARGLAPIARRRRDPRLAVALWLVLLDGAACSTTYQPRPSGRVGIVMRHSALMYIKDGRQVPVGPFSGQLEGLVAETPPAVVHARRAHTQLMIGIPAYLAGAVGVIVGMSALAGPIGWVVIGAGASTMGTGLGFLGSGVTNVMDAVGKHNDAISTVRPP